MKLKKVVNKIVCAYVFVCVWIIRIDQTQRSTLMQLGVGTHVFDNEYQQHLLITVANTSFIKHFHRQRYSASNPCSKNKPMIPHHPLFFNYR